MERFRLSTGSEIGTRTRRSQESRTRRRRPPPSDPRTRATLPVRSAPARISLALPSSPRHQNSESLRVFRVRATLTVRTKGTHSTAPDAALQRAPVTGGPWRSWTTTAAAPKAAATRMTAPTFRGSDAWSRTTMTASSVFAVGSASSMATSPSGPANSATPWWTAPGPRRRSISPRSRLSISGLPGTD